MKPFKHFLFPIKLKCYYHFSFYLRHNGRRSLDDDEISHGMKKSKRMTKSFKSAMITNNANTQINIGFEKQVCKSLTFKK